MKKQILILVILTFSIVQFWGCDEDSIYSRIKGSGNIVDVEYSFSNFQRIDVSQAFELSVVKADTFEVLLLVDDNIVPYLDVQRSGNWLIIDLEGDHSYNNVNLRAEIRMPYMEYIKGSGATAISVSGFGSDDGQDDFQLELSGASVFSGNIVANNCDIQLSGASIVNMSGSCNDLYLMASGASELNMGNFVSVTAFFIWSGATSGTVHVSDHLDATLSGASVLRYYGNPEIGNLNISGASTIIKL